MIEEAVYPYQDELGNVLFEVVRLQGKKFTQRRPDGERMGNVRRVLYHLPALLAHVASNTRQPIYIVDGEKDVHAIERVGGTATCNVGGAGGAKWLPEMVESLQGARNVIVVVDQDGGVGMEQAANWVKALGSVGISPRVVRAAQGKDAHDHLTAGFGLEEFVDVTMPRRGPLSAIEAARWFEHKLLNPPDPLEEGVPTPWPGTLGTLRKGRLHLLGGYPADGKTAMMLQFLRVACEATKGVRVQSIEMTGEELVERLVAAYGVAYNHAQSGRVQGPERDLALRAIEELARWNFEIDDDPDVTPADIEERIAETGPDVVMVDHIHAFGHKDRFDVEHTARALKAVAKRQGVPMLVLAHLSRSKKFRQNDSAFPRPDMARLRESGMLEAWADTIWFAWRHRDERDLPGGSGELIVAKSRFTKTGFAELVFDGNFQRWEGGYT